MKHVKVKMTGVSYHSKCQGTITKLANCRFRFKGFKELTSNVMLICLEVKQHAKKIEQCIKRVEC